MWVLRVGGEHPDGQTDGGASPHPSASSPRSQQLSHPPWGLPHACRVYPHRPPAGETTWGATHWGWAVPCRVGCSSDQALGAARLRPAAPLTGICDQVSCSCRKGYSGDGIRACVLLDPCSQVRPPGHPQCQRGRGRGGGCPAFLNPSGVLSASEGPHEVRALGRGQGSSWPLPQGWLGPRKPGSHRCLSPVPTAEQRRLQPLCRVQKHRGWPEDLRLRRSPHRGGWLHLPSPCQPGNDAQGGPRPDPGCALHGPEPWCWLLFLILTPPRPDPVTVHETHSDPRADRPGFPFLISALARPWAPGAGTSTSPDEADQTLS